MELIMAEAEKPDLTNLTVQLLSAYVTNNTVESKDLAELIRSTRSALSDDASPATASQAEYVPAVSIRKSLASRDHIISLIDGKPYKTLRRHLSTQGLSPAEYRTRYGLPSDYPMVAPGYSEQRREVAQRLGLGRKRTKPTSAPEATAPASEAAQQSAGAAESSRDAPNAKAPAAAKRSTRKPKAEAPSSTGAKSYRSDQGGETRDPAAWTASASSTAVDDGRADSATAGAKEASSTRTRAVKAPARAKAKTASAPSKAKASSAKPAAKKAAEPGHGEAVSKPGKGAASRRGVKQTDDARASHDAEAARAEQPSE
jgi:predicted transcriptional regulator